MDITDPAIERYLMGLSAEDDPLLLKMEDKARESGFPIVDRLVGRLIYILTRLKRPGLVVELGSGFGYSAYWFARAMESGTVVLTDHSHERMDYAREVFRASGMLGKAEFRVGDAVDIAREYRDIDILFIDIEKEEYRRAAETLLPNLGGNALVIADNTLWYGKVLDERPPDKATEGIRRFNEYMFSREDFFSTIVPLRDGVLVSFKLL